MAAIDVGTRLAQILGGGGASAIFGVPGGQTLPLYGAADTLGVNHVLVRDERNAACAADAFSRVSGAVGFCDATVGPGVTNLVSGLAEAYTSSIPVVAIIADIRSDRTHLGRRSVTSQAIDQGALLAPITKWVGRVERATALDAVFDQAVRIATTGRPGPVCIEIPEDVFRDVVGDSETLSQPASGRFTYPRLRSAPAPLDVETAVALLAGAKRPIILAGGGAVFSDASDAIARLAEECLIPVATSINGKGTIDERSPLSVGVTGSFGNARANTAMLAADVVLVLGSKLDQITTHQWQVPSRSQKVIHVDIDGEEIGRAIPVALGICADARETAIALREALQPGNGNRRNWADELDITPVEQTLNDGAISPKRMLDVMNDVLTPDDVVVCDASYSSGWASANFQVKRAGRVFIAPRGFAGIGWSGGASLGARLAAEPSRRVVVLAGDGGWCYSLSEVETAARLGLDITYIILNNAGLGWIKHNQDRQGMAPSLFSQIDFGAVARGMGAGGVQVRNLEDFEAEFQRGLAEDGPFVVDAISSINASPIFSLGSVPKGAYA